MSGDEWGVRRGVRTSRLSRVPTCMPTMWAESFSLTIPSACVALLMMVLYLAALAVKVPVSFPLAVRLHLAPCWALGGWG